MNTRFYVKEFVCIEGWTIKVAWRSSSSTDFSKLSMSQNNFNNSRTNVPIQYLIYVFQFSTLCFFPKLKVSE